MNRRKALNLLFAMAVLPTAAVAQPNRVRVVGYLAKGDGYPRRLAGRLRELGYEEGRNLRFEVRRVPRAPTAEQVGRAAADLATSGAEVIVASGSDNVSALHRATRRIPIVSGGVGNPVTIGVARSLREPGMNVTGLSFGLEENAVLQFGTLKRLRPRLKRVTFLIPASSARTDLPPEHLSAATTLGIVCEAAPVNGLGEIKRVLGSMRDATAEAAWVDEFSAPIRMKEIADLAIRQRVATYAKEHDWVRQGFLFGGGLVHSDPPLRIATIVDKILRGADPATIPFEQPDKTELVLNLATAAAIGIQIPDDVRLRATQIVG